VSDGTRTRDIRDHNAALYQLSYTHHCLGHHATTPVRSVAYSTCPPGPITTGLSPSVAG
jgi:hypothetical protein